MAGAFLNRPAAPNYALNMYFTGYFYVSMERQDSVMAALNASLVTELPDPTSIRAFIQTLYDNVTVLPYMEEVKARFYQYDAHDDGALEYSSNYFVSEIAWLEPELR